MTRLFTVKAERNIFDIDVCQIDSDRYFAEGFESDTFDGIIKKLQSEYGSLKIVDGGK